jgi:aminomethyltransferase
VFITAPDGGIINDPILLRLDENHFWISVADSDVLLWAMGVAYNSGLDVKIGEPDVGPMQIQGPKSRDVLVDLLGDSVLEIPYYFCHDYELEGMSVMVSRTGYTSEIGFEIYCRDASHNAIKLWDLVLEAGKPHGLAVIGPCHIRRIEGGILAYGADMWLDTNPYEVDLGYEWMVDLDQEADFVGKEALRRIKEQGISRKLVGVEIGGARLGSYNDGSMMDFFPVYADGNNVGRVTSACFSPRLEKNIGYAMVPIDHAELGTELEVETPAERTSAVVVRRPFIDPEKEIPKQDLAAAGARDESSS